MTDIILHQNETMDILNGVSDKIAPIVQDYLANI
jgi:hypothetical protein